MRPEPRGANLTASVAAELQRAHQLMGRGQLQEAEAICQQVVSAAPALPDAVHLLGLIRRRQGNLREAESLLLRSLELAPTRADYHANYGNLLRAAGRLTDAETEYRRALNLDPHFQPAQLGLARLLVSCGRAAEAESLIRSSIAYKPEDPIAWQELGAALGNQDRLQEAEAAYRRALEIEPRYALARHNLGALLSRLKRAEEALEELDRAYAVGARGSALHFNRARALLELLRLDEAEGELEAALRLAPADEQTLVFLTKIRFMRGDIDYARALRTAIESHPAGVGLRNAYASMLRAAGQLESAKVAFESAIEKCGPNPALLMGLAVTHQEAGRYDAALAVARSGIERRPALAAHITAYTAILLSLGRAEEALRLMREARARTPLSQEFVALEATAARLLDDPAYRELYDYDRFVRVYDLEPPAGFRSMAEFNAALLKVLNERHCFSTHPLDQSLRFGTQTARSLLVDPSPIVGQFLQALAAPIADYRSQIGVRGDHPLLARNRGDAELAGCWSARLVRGGYHVNHIHPEGWLSSAYYVHTPAEVADPDAKSGWIKFGEPRYPVPGAAPERLIQPRPGRLVLFPSYMWHGTTPITTDEPRVTIAFDVVTCSDSDKTGPADGP